MLDQPAEDQSRRGKARERQRRRRERSPVSSKQRSTGTRRSRIQLSPAGDANFQLDLRYLRPVLMGIGSLAFMGLVILAVGLFKNDPAQVQPNALWVGDDWTYRPHDDAAVREFASLLKAHGIGSIFARVSELNIDGTWTGRIGQLNRFTEVEADVRQFAQQIKAEYPNLQLYGTVGVRADIGERGYRLDEQTVHQIVAEFSARVVNDLGFDGVMLAVEPVWDGDENFLSLVRRVRSSIGGDALLAVAVPPDWTPTEVDVPVPVLIEPGTVWSTPYKQRVALLQIDLIMIQAYNSYLTRSDEYIDWMAYQTQAFAEAIASLNAGTQILIGIPTYADERPAHDVRVENITTAIAGVQRGLLALGENASLVRGVAVYASWDTGEDEWAQIREFWTK